ncbi:hypothetical protein K1719_036174 [Acacia pycnantha]|nr:hypothetical protein K1719_036174 [Acacia pycnantha]
MKMMSLRRGWVVAMTVALWIAIVSVGEVEGSRVLRPHFATATHLRTYAEANTSLRLWLMRLASGPSPKGPGH